MAPPRVVHVGGRDFDPGERERMAEVGLRSGAGALADVSAEVSRWYVHLDLDVLDPAVAVANAYAAPGGLTVEEVRSLLAGAVPRAAASITAYDPSVDRDGRALRAGRELLAALG